MKSYTPSLRIATALACLAVSVSAHAGEADTFCELAQAKAKTSSAILAAPEVFGNIGDPVTAERSMTIGMRNSIARTRRAGLTEQLAEAECAAYRAETRLTEQVSGVEARAELLSLINMQDKLAAALDQAEKNVQIEKQLLESKNARLSDLKTAFEQYDALGREMASAQARRARIQNQLPDVEESLNGLLQDSINTQVEVANLTAKLAKSSAWDVTYAAGMRADLRDNGQKGFVAVTATYSLGKKASDQAAARVADLSAQLLREQRDGATQSFVRAKDSIRGLIAAEKLTRDSLVKRKAMLDEAHDRVANIATTDGERMKRTLAVELLAIEATLAGANARVSYLTNWLDRNDAQ
ncbi:hypothetical protein ACOTC5_29960 [Achromobacter xylosoxidans]